MEVVLPYLVYAGSLAIAGSIITLAFQYKAQQLGGVLGWSFGLLLGSLIFTGAFEHADLPVLAETAYQWTSGIGLTVGGISLFCVFMMICLSL